MTSPITHTIIIAYDNPEALEFATWLADNDHDVSIGISTGNYVDGTHQQQRGGKRHHAQSLGSLLQSNLIANKFTDPLDNRKTCAIIQPMAGAQCVALEPYHRRDESHRYRVFRDCETLRRCFCDSAAMGNPSRRPRPQKHPICKLAHFTAQTRCAAIGVAQEQSRLRANCVLQCNCQR